MEDRQVRLTVVGDEIEADMLTQLLDAAGIGCAYRPLEGASTALAGPGVPTGFAHEVIVWESSLDAAREVLERFNPS
jgi:hypothetical protein